MIALGILRTCVPRVPTLGFLAAWVLLFALQLVNPFTYPCPCACRLNANAPEAGDGAIRESAPGAFSTTVQ